MYTRTITCEDFNGNEYTEDCMFNLTETEIIELQTGTDGGFGEYLGKLIKANNMPKVMEFFKMFILKSYGIKSLDGKRFEKSEEISKAFSETQAYNKIFMELCTDPKKAQEFILGVAPKQLADKAKDIIEKGVDIKDIQNTQNISVLPDNK